MTKEEKRHIVFEKSMAILIDAAGPDHVQDYWENNWREFNVNMDIMEDCIKKRKCFKNKEELMLRKKKAKL